MIDFKAFVEEAARMVRSKRGADTTVISKMEYYDATYGVTLEFIVWDGTGNHRGPTPDACLAALREAYENPINLEFDMYSVTLPSAAAEMEGVIAGPGGPWVNPEAKA